MNGIDLIELNDCVFLDTETTGLNGGYGTDSVNGDEIIELCICNGDGEVLLNTLVKPVHKISWEQAQKIHGIAPEHVMSAPSLKNLMPEILEVVKGKTVVIYNAGFDVKFFPKGTFDNSIVRCCMLEFAEKIGDWNDYRGSYRWHKLGAAAAHVGYEWDGKAHRALADVQATISVWNWLHDD